jgi:transcriptional regulator with XRE-family HTH domain
MFPGSKTLAARFGKRLAQRRTEWGWSQDELAERAGTTGPAVSHAETGKHVPRLDVAAQYARALGMSLDDLVAVRATRRGARRADGHRRPAGWPPATTQQARAKITEVLNALPPHASAEELIGGVPKPLEWAVLGLLRHDKRPLYDTTAPHAAAVALCLEEADRFGERWFFDELAAALRVGIGPDRRQRHLAATLRLERLAKKQRRGHAKEITATKKRAEDAQRRLRRARRNPDRAEAARERLVASSHLRGARKAYQRLVKAAHALVGSDTDRRLNAKLTQEILGRGISTEQLVTPAGPDRRVTAVRPRRSLTRRIRAFQAAAIPPSRPAER